MGDWRSIWAQDITVESARDSGLMDSEAYKGVTATFKLGGTDLDKVKSVKVELFDAQGKLLATTWLKSHKFPLSAGNLTAPIVAIEGTYEYGSWEKTQWTDGNPDPESVPSYVVMTLIDNYGVDYNAEERNLHTVYSSGKTWGQLLTSAVNTDKNKEYLNLQDAINDAGKRDTIKLLRNVRLKTTGLVVGAEKNVILDLAGHVLSGVFDNEGSSALITNHGTLTIIDTGGTGKITNQALNPDTEWEPGFPAYANNTITNHGQLTIEGGRIENTTSGGASYVIDNNSTISDAVVVVEGGYIVNPNNNFAIRQFANSTKNKNSVTINDGVVEGTRAVWIQLPGSSGQQKRAELTVKGGTLRSTDKDGYNLAVYSYTFGDSFAATKITINGGVFDGDIALTGGNSKDTTETVQVKGGYFKGDYGVYSYGEMDGFITGGYFMSDKAQNYLAEGYTFGESDDAEYPYKVVENEEPVEELVEDGQPEK
jgi:hypothetical protein